MRWEDRPVTLTNPYLPPLLCYKKTTIVGNFLVSQSQKSGNKKVCFDENKFFGLNLCRQRGTGFSWPKINNRQNHQCYHQYQSGFPNQVTI
jgi:hypothetical protein